MSPTGDLEAPLGVIKEAVARALAEDSWPLGDLTASLIDPDLRTRMLLVSRTTGILAGSRCALETFAQVDDAIDVEWDLPDGSRLEKGSLIARIDGPMRSILTAERTALNFVGHLSGVATATARIVAKVNEVSSCTRVIDTRKTIPGLRSLQKAAVRAGGGYNHRANLSDAVLVKDNHLGALSITEAVARAASRWPGRMIEVECDTIDQARQAAHAGATVVMLDNMTPALAKDAVAAIREIAPSLLIEVSGGIDESNAPDYAAIGVDLISVGSLTHSAKALDLGLDLA